MQDQIGGEDLEDRRVVMALAVEKCFLELGEKCSIYCYPDKTDYAGLVFMRTDGEWSMTISWGSDAIFIWPPGGYKVCGPSLSDPKFFEKCIKIMSGDTAPH
jgi:hypothetical protein